MLQSIQKLAANNCIATDSEICNQTMPLPIEKSTAKNYVNVVLEKKNYIITDSEISSQ